MPLIDNDANATVQSKPRIALFTKDLRSGGAEKTWVNLAGLLAEPGDIAVDLVVCSATGPYLKNVSKDVRLIDLQAKRMVSSIPALTSYIRQERPIAILSALEHANVSAIIARAAAKSGTRVLISIHNNLSRNLEMGSLKLHAERLFIRATYRHADRLIAVSKGVADDLAVFADVDRSRIDVVNNPTVTDALLEKSQNSLTHPWFAAGQPRVILSVGRLNKQKDQAMLIRAFAKVRSEQNVRLLILGEGEERPALEALSAELGLKLGIDGDVLMPGFVDNPYVYMSHSAVFALSSRFEGAPAVLIEAMACGAVCVSTDCPSGPNEILEGGRWGKLTPVGDDESFSRALLYSLSDGIKPPRSAWEPYREKLSALAYRSILLPDLVQAA